MSWFNSGRQDSCANSECPLWIEITSLDDAQPTSCTVHQCNWRTATNHKFPLCNTCEMKMPGPSAHCQKWPSINQHPVIYWCTSLQYHIASPSQPSQIYGSDLQFWTCSHPSGWCHTFFHQVRHLGMLYCDRGGANACLAPNGPNWMASKPPSLTTRTSALPWLFGTESREGWRDSCCAHLHGPCQYRPLGTLAERGQD